jgi:hypothetical protein
MSLETLLENLERGGEMATLRDVYQRCTVFPGLWNHVHEILNSWDRVAGNQVSYGFKFTCRDPEAFRRDMRARRTFCEDSVAVHGDADCFRELIRTGPGLHVCVTRPASLGRLDFDIHIDIWQMVCARQDNGICDYSHANLQFLRHMRHAGPWVVRDTAGRIRQGAERLIRSLTGP